MNELNVADLLKPDGPTYLVVKGILEPVGGLDRFQPAGFPEVGHVLYEAPRAGNCTEKVCIVDSPASMANHLETVCLMGPNDPGLHGDLAGLPYVCVCQLDLAPFDTLIWPHLAFVPPALAGAFS